MKKCWKPLRDEEVRRQGHKIYIKAEKEQRHWGILVESVEVRDKEGQDTTLFTEKSMI